MNRRIGHQAGFSMISTVVGLAIMSIGMLAFNKLMATSMKSQRGLAQIRAGQKLLADVEFLLSRHDVCRANFGAKKIDEPIVLTRIVNADASHTFYETGTHYHNRKLEFVALKVISVADLSSGVGQANLAVQFRRIGRGVSKSEKSLRTKLNYQYDLSSKENTSCSTAGLTEIPRTESGTLKGDLCMKGGAPSISERGVYCDGAWVKEITFDKPFHNVPKVTVGHTVLHYAAPNPPVPGDVGHCQGGGIDAAAVRVLSVSKTKMRIQCFVSPLPECGAQLPGKRYGGWAAKSQCSYTVSGI